MKTSFVFTSTAEHLASLIKDKVKDFEFIFPEKNKEGKRHFPDGEVYIRIPGVKKLKKKRVIIFHSGMPEPNAGLVELELILQILKDHRIRPKLFFTYFPYGRQDKIFKTGETNAAESLIKKLTDYYQTKKIYIIDPHFGKREWLKKYPVVSLSALSCLVDRGKKDFGGEFLLMTPDKGGKRRTGIQALNKKRINSFEVMPFSPKAAVRGKTIGVVDDLIGTGGTLLRFCEFAENSGAEKVVALATHGVLEAGVKKTKNRFAKLYLANTIGQKEANVDVTDLIINAVRIS